MRIRLISLCFLLWSSWPSVGARADFITTLTESTTQSLDGTYNYSYMLEVSQASDAFAIVLGVNVGPAANLHSFVAPVGWDVDYAPGSLVATWEATDPTAPILPGSGGIFGF